MKKEKLDFSLVVTDIGSWVNENGQELLETAILENETISFVTTYPGVKYKEELKYLSTDANIVAQACGTPTSSGTTTISKKDVEVKSVMVFEELCPKDLESTSLQLSMAPGTPEGLPFEGQYTAQKVKQIQKSVEDKFWIGASGATAIAGIINQMLADSDVTDVVFDFSATGLTDTQLIAGLNTVIDAIPEVARNYDDITLFLGHDLFRRISRAYLNTANVLLQKFDFNGTTAFVVPGSEDIMLKPVNGLNKANNTNQVVLAVPAHTLLYVCDMQSEEESTKMWYSQDDIIVKFLAEWKWGAAYTFGALSTLSAKA